jgi:hypothetical protein
MNRPLRAGIRIVLPRIVLPLEPAVEVRVEAAGAAGVSSAGREIVKRQR